MHDLLPSRMIVPINFRNILAYIRINSVFTGAAYFQLTVPTMRKSTSSGTSL